MKRIALIVAAGRGVRAGGDLPKQYRRLGQRTVLARAAEAFETHPEIDAVRVVIHADDEDLYEAAFDGPHPKRLGPVIGGGDRQESVRRGLTSLKGEGATAVLIHDAARPFVNHDAISRSLAALAAHDGACVAAPLVDTLRREGAGDSLPVCGELVDRAGLWRAQTPQTFSYASICAAHEAHVGDAATDDAELARRAGLSVALVEGAPENLKLTTPADFAWAERWIMAEAAMTGQAGDRALGETRIGQGFDVHKFGPNADGSTDHVMLCGVAVPHENGLVGHSDADVGLHALTDAIFGAIAEGDIGAHFPPSDPQWRGTASHAFLRRAGERVRERGGRLINADVTLICERPKIGPHADAMRARIAEILEITVDRVSVKATTSEKLGFTGRGEGIAALASASVLL